MLQLFKISKFFALIFLVNQANFTTANASNVWQGIVTHITDGDTFRARPVDSNIKSDSIKIRIDGIDAPESCQLYGSQATEVLKKLILSRKVTVFRKRFDDYGREVAKITFNNMDLGGWMVKNGYAWSYHHRFNDGPYGSEEKTAAREKLGLFADASVIEPKVFRREHGSCYAPTKKNHKQDK